VFCFIVASFRFTQVNQDLIRQVPAWPFGGARRENPGLSRVEHLLVSFLPGSRLGIVGFDDGSSRVGYVSAPLGTKKTALTPWQICCREQPRNDRGLDPRIRRHTSWMSLIGIPQAEKRQA
jgi:hypothetical protein